MCGVSSVGERRRSTLGWPGLGGPSEGEWSDQEAAGRGVQLEGSGRLSAAPAVPRCLLYLPDGNLTTQRTASVVRAPSQMRRARLRDR